MRPQKMLLIVLIDFYIDRECLARPWGFLRWNNVAVRAMRMYRSIGDPSHYYWLKLRVVDRLINRLQRWYLGT